MRPKAAGDRASELAIDEDDDMNDNLASHLGQLSTEAESDNSNIIPLKRKLTLEEKQELRGTMLVKRRGTSDNKDAVTFDDFNFLMVIGRGTFGKVFLAELKATKQLFAIKSIRKDVLI